MQRVLRIIPWIIMAVGLLVIIGWFTSTDFLIRITDNLPPMKFLSATFFVISGVQLLYLGDLIQQSPTRGARSTIGLAATMIVLCSLGIVMNAVPTIGNLYDALPHEAKYDAWARIPAVPSLATLVSFIIFSITILALPIIPNKIKPLLVVSGNLIIAIGLIAVVGGALGIPELFYAFSWGGGMALHSGLLFALMGFCVFLHGRHANLPLSPASPQYR